MKVKMNVQMSGTRNGDPWPPPGDTVELPDLEAAKLCANGLASAMASKDPVEKAVIDDDDDETRDDDAPAKKAAAKRRKSS